MWGTLYIVLLSCALADYKWTLKAECNVMGNSQLSPLLMWVNDNYTGIKYET